MSAAPSLFDVPPAGEQILADLASAYVQLAALDNVRPDDVDNALRAAVRVKAGRKAACAEVYAFLLARWPEPVSGTAVVSRFLGQMRDPERRLRELREAMTAAHHDWAVENVDGTWHVRPRVTP